jgi:hypothetical protein
MAVGSRSNKQLAARQQLLYQPQSSMLCLWGQFALQTGKETQISGLGIAPVLGQEGGPVDVDKALGKLLDDLCYE